MVRDFQMVLNQKNLGTTALEWGNTMQHDSALVVKDKVWQGGQEGGWEERFVMAGGSVGRGVKVVLS